MPFSKVQDFVKSFPAAKGMTPEQQQKAMEIFNSMKKEDPKMDDGMAIGVAMKEAMKKEEMMNEESFFYVSMLADIEEKTSIIEVLKEGRVHDRNLVITKEMMKDYVKNFRAGVYGTEIQVNLRHDRNGEAAGWVKDLYIDGDRLLAQVDWTPLGVEKVGTKRYKFTSSELATSFPHVETGEPVKNVLIGVALTNIPAVKGLKAVTLSEQAQHYISNFDNMKKFKELKAELEAKKVVTLSEYKAFEEAAEAAVEAGEATAEEAKEATEEVKEKVESKEEEAPAVPPVAAPAEALSMQKFAERLDSLAEENKKKDEIIAELTEKQKASEQKIELNELQEDIKKTLCLSEGKVSTGFNPSDETVGRVSKFMLNLSQEQRKEFKEILALHQTVDLSQRGASAGTSSVSQDLNEDLKNANAEAKKRFEANPKKELHVHLAEIMAENGLVNKE